MANEAVFAGGNFKYKSVTVADGNAIALGALIVVGNGVGTSHAAANESFLGIAAESKAANDGKVNLRVAVAGDFDIIGTASITAGELVYLSGTANKVTGLSGAVTLSGTDFARLVGKALTTGTTARVRLGEGGVA